MKSFLKVAKVSFMVMVCALFLGIGIKAEAAPAAVTNLRQTADDVDAVKVEWAAPQGDVAGYKIEFCDNTAFTGNGYKSGTLDGNVGVVTGLKAGSSYFFRVTAIDSTGAEGAISQTLEVVTAPADTMKVTGVKQTNASKNAVSLSWNAFSGANMYVVQYRVYETTTIKDVEVRGNKATIAGLTEDTPYVASVLPARISSKGYTAYGFKTSLSNSMMAYTLPKKITNLKFSQGGIGNKSSAAWAKFKYSYDGKVASGVEYTIYGNNGKKLFTNTTKSFTFTAKNKKLTNTQFMKIKARTYIVVNGQKKYGPYSDDCWFARFPSGVKAKKAGKMAADGVKVSWKKVKGAKNYTVSISTSPNGGYKKVTTTSKTSATIKKCRGAKLVSGRSYYYRVVANTKKKVGKKTKSFKSDESVYGSFRFTTRYVYR